ncbi:MAG TPA: hypothetical protein VFC86_13270 [Planctomycetota bacterium]|nr:hypothetical protein [Planctomycetota bacterium]
MKRAAGFIAIALGVMFVLPALAQKSAERYIPIGQSPGLSGKVTYLGKIGTQDEKAKKIGGKEWSATITDKTHIWVDRSKQKKTATVGTLADLKAGHRVEVKYEGSEAGKKEGPAEWIKVEAEPADK